MHYCIFFLFMETLLNIALDVRKSGYTLTILNSPNYSHNILLPIFPTIIDIYLFPTNCNITHAINYCFYREFFYFSAVKSIAAA